MVKGGMARPRTTANALVTLAVLGAALLACKKKVPPHWEPLVPTKGLTKVIDLEGDPALGTVPGAMVWYEQSDVTVQEIRTDFLSRAKAQGYEQISECADKPDKPGDGFIKAPRTYLGFSLLPLAKSWDVRLQRSSTLVSITLPQNRKCNWLPTAAKYCGGDVPSGRTCLLQQ